MIFNICCSMTLKKKLETQRNKVQIFFSPNTVPAPFPYNGILKANIISWVLQSKHQQSLRQCFFTVIGLWIHEQKYIHNFMRRLIPTSRCSSPLVFPLLLFCFPSLFSLSSSPLSTSLALFVSLYFRQGTLSLVQKRKRNLAALPTLCLHMCPGDGSQSHKDRRNTQLAYTVFL